MLPALGQAVYAGRGLGAWWDGEPARVSATAALDGAYLSTSSYSHWPDDDLLAVKHAGCQLRTWGDGYGYALVATGRVDAMVDHVVEVYDVAPMPVILAEAGGRFTSLDGARGAAGGSGVATNGVDPRRPAGAARRLRLRPRQIQRSLPQVAEQDANATIAMSARAAG